MNFRECLPSRRASVTFNLSTRDSPIPARSPALATGGRARSSCRTTRADRAPMSPRANVRSPRAWRYNMAARSNIAVRLVEKPRRHGRRRTWSRN